MVHLRFTGASDSRSSKSRDTIGDVIHGKVTFFDYLDLQGTKIRNCVPRLPAWDDKAISAFDNINFAQLKFKDITRTCFMEKPSCIPSSHTLPNGVVHFIDALIPSDDDFRAKMKEMCTEFYKTSMDACLNALQPILAKQMCTMVETIQNQVNNRASSSSTPPVNELTCKECNPQKCTMPDGVSARPLQTVIDTEFHNPSVGPALGTVESTGGGDILHYDPNDGDVVNGLLQLRRHGGSVIGDTPFGALVTDQAVVAMSSEQDFGTKGSPSAGTEVGHPESNQISATECSRASKRHIDLAVYIDSESESSRPLKIQKTRNSACGDK